MSIQNLKWFYGQADAVDRREGLIAYPRYHELMAEIARHFASAVPAESPAQRHARVIQAFVAMSPNNDYLGNLRSLVSILTGLQKGVHVKEITVSGYNHCRDRAYKYLIGSADFWNSTKGPKIRNFYMNIMFPDSPLYCTIDGHIHAAWRNQNLTMRSAIVPPKKYGFILHDMLTLAAEIGILPNQLQATIWFTRKRLYGIRVPHADLFLPADDQWQIVRNISEIKPYA